MAVGDEEEETAIRCANCGHKQRIGANGGRCLLCGRAFSASQARAHSRRLSFSHVAFGAHAGELARRLEERRTATAGVLAMRGREIEAEFSRWAIDAPDDERRVKTISSLADWSRRALDLLSGSR